jgi:hypothetical protein
MVLYWSKQRLINFSNILGGWLETEGLDISDHARLQSHDSGETVLRYFAGREAFPGTKYLMRLYQRRVVTGINVHSTAGVGVLDVGRAVVLSGDYFILSHYKRAYVL